VRAQRGFTLLETLLALSIALPLGFAVLAIVGGGLRAATTAATAGSNADSLATLIERLDAEAHSAAAIFTPRTDVFGAPSCDASGACRELDFFTRDAKNAPHFWAYLYDPSAKTLTRYAYDDLSANGPANLRPYGQRLTNVTGFSAKRIPVSQLTIPALAGYVATDVVVPFGYPGVAGGNALLGVDVQNAAMRLHHELVPRLAATGFSVVVGTYAPSAPPTSAPPSTFGRQYAYYGFTEWQIGPCVSVIKIVTPGCGLNGDDSGLLAEQDGADVAAGGTLTAPPDSRITLADVCRPPGALAPNAVSLVASTDARGNSYVQVSDAALGIGEWWSVSTTDYVSPQLPMRPRSATKPSPLGPTLNQGPGYWYFTTYWLSC
jgi:prepilin-type N-terminal cleavage/methylation domain-containing protein